MNTITLLSISFILSVFSANEAPSTVLDVTGKTLQAGVNYSVIPAVGNSSGGDIAPGPTDPHKTCPLGITQLQAKKHGLPLTSAPVNLKKRVIRLSIDANIKFSGPTSCNESNVKRLKYDEAIQQYFVTVGGVQGNPGRETLDNWFKVEKTEDGFKFVFCPTLCNFCKVLCRDVGIFVDDHGNRRLALRDVPFSVHFYAIPVPQVGPSHAPTP